MFETGSANDLEDLLSKLSTFATATAGVWVEDEFDTGNGKFALHKSAGFGDIYVSARWDTGTPLHLSLHQALGFTASNEPGTHPDDSGNGYNTNSSHTNTNLASERHVSDLGDGPFPSYFFFEDDHYIHVVVEIDTDTFRHFGFGFLNPKHGTFTGGEYCYGHRTIQSTNHSPLNGADYALLDGLCTQEPHCPTVHVEGLPNQPGSSKWGVCFVSASGPINNDTGGNAREGIQGGFRSGPIAGELGKFTGSALTGNVPMYPITIWHRDYTDDRIRPLGTMPDVRALNIRHFLPRQEVVIGSDTWVMFPFSLKTLDNIVERSYYSGIAYKKVAS